MCSKEKATSWEAGGLGYSPSSPVGTSWSSGQIPETSGTGFLPCETGHMGWSLPLWWCNSKCYTYVCTELWVTKTWYISENYLINKISHMQFKKSWNSLSKHCIIVFGHGLQTQEGRLRIGLLFTTICNSHNTGIQAVSSRVHTHSAQRAGSTWMSLIHLGGGRYLTIKNWYFLFQNEVKA